MKIRRKKKKDIEITPLDAGIGGLVLGGGTWLSGKVPELQAKMTKRANLAEKAQKALESKVPQKQKAAGLVIAGTGAALTAAGIAKKIRDKKKKKEDDNTEE